MTERFTWDENIFYIINSFAGKSDIADKIFVFMGEYIIFIMMGIFVLFFAKKIWEDKKMEIKEVLLYFSTPVLAWVITHIIKWFFPADRPYVMENTIQLSQEFDPGSFPSGHTTLAFAMMLNIYIYNKKWGIVFIVLALGVSSGRVLVGLHFPLDILAGALIGIIVPIVFHKLWNIFEK
jgi:undecaprenyl-diphosphatase